MRAAFFGSVLGVALVLLVLFWVTTQPLVRPIATNVPSVSPERLKAHVRMLSETLHPRSIDNLTNLEAAADYVHAQLAGSGAVVPTSGSRMAARSTAM